MEQKEAEVSDWNLAGNIAACMGSWLATCHDAENTSCSRNYGFNNTYVDVGVCHS